MRNNRFTFLCTLDERHLLTSVSKRLARTESDTIRCLIRAAARELLLAPDEITEPIVVREQAALTTGKLFQFDNQTDHLMI